VAWTRTFGWSERFYGMTDTAIRAKKTVEVGKKQILDQRTACIVGQGITTREHPKEK